MNIIIIGLGSVSRSIADILTTEFNYNIKGYIGTDEEGGHNTGKIIYKNIPFLGTRKILNQIKKIDVNGFIVAIGDRYIREEVFNEAKNSGLVPINAISKNAIVEGNVSIGMGVVIGSGSIIQNGVQIGDNTHIGSGVILDFSCILGSNCNIKSGALIGRRANILKNCQVGYRCCVSSDVQIGKNQSIQNYQKIDKNLQNLLR